MIRVVVLVVIGIGIATILYDSRRRKYSATVTYGLIIGSIFVPLIVPFYILFRNSFRLAPTNSNFSINSESKKTNLCPKCGTENPLHNKSCKSCKNPLIL